jgi:predicted methyltransferase MtxX (methanogen marker protein 4)
MILNLEKLALKSNAKVAIGVDTDPRLRGRTIAGAMQAKTRKFANPILVGKDLPTHSELQTISSNTPESKLFSLLQNNEVDGVIRGSFQAGKVIKILQQELKGLTDSGINHSRLALIQNPLSEEAFLISPVGIEEGHTVQEKKLIILDSIKILKLIGIKPKISVLAAGIKNIDLGRYFTADQTINDAESIVNEFKNKFDISTPGILIEQAIEKRKNIIIPMNGISGNLLYRTLVYIGDWKSYGAALLFTEKNSLNGVYIDTSHRGNVHQYRRAIMFASALANLSF